MQKRKDTPRAITKSYRLKPIMISKKDQIERITKHIYLLRDALEELDKQILDILTEHPKKTIQSV